MSQLILNILTYIITFQAMHTGFALSFINKKYLNDLSNQKAHYISFFQKLKNDLSFEIPQNVFRADSFLKYQICFHAKYNLHNENFSLLKYTIFQDKYDYCFFKHVILIGYGYNILNGPIYYSKIECSPCLYYVRQDNVNYFKILGYTSGTYSYQIIKNVYYSQYLSVLANFGHLATKLENSLSISLKDDTMFLKFGHNAIFNENKFLNLLPNVNKYISVSFVYFF